MKPLAGAVPIALLLAATLAGCLSPGPADGDTDSTRLLITVDSDTDLFVVHANGTFNDGSSPDEIHWDWGDGTSGMGHPDKDHTYVRNGTYNVTASANHPTAGRLSASQEVVIGTVPLPDPDDDEDNEAPPETPAGLIPHVIIGIPDTGINVYHEMYYRPELDVQPCTYIQDYPCDIPALSLSVGPDLDMTFEERVAADQAIWDSVEPGDVYWIPQTVFIGAICEEPYTGSITDPGGLEGDICILDDSHMHGTGTTSSALMENPDALFVFKEGGSAVEPILESGIPIDILSVSWGGLFPFPGSYDPFGPIYITSSGNDPRSTIVDDKGDPDVIAVGGAYAEDDTQEPMAGNQAEFVSYYCRPVAQTQSLDELRSSYCGTSFAAPTVAGATSKVILELRERSGYVGGIVNGFVDPLLEVTKDDIRQAMRHTGSYSPTSQYPNTSIGLPLNPAAPYVQWGWGFMDGLVADDTIRYLDGEMESNKDEAAVIYLETIDMLQETTHS